MKYYGIKDYLMKAGPIRTLLRVISPYQLPVKDSSNEFNELVFITGIHRSGTSWIGDVLSCSGNAVYWREPYNPSTVKTMRQQFLYISDVDSDIEYKKFTNDMLLGKYVASLFDYTSRSQWFLTGSAKHIIKDPTAAFMLEWILENYNSKILIVNRHPAGFISSILKLNWDFDFNNILSQQALIDNYLLDYVDIIRQYNYVGMDVSKASVLWCVIYKVLERMTQNNDKVVWVKYEDICTRPLEKFKQIANLLNLEWTDQIQQKIEKSTESNVTFSNNITKNHIRDTLKMTDIWKERLSSADLDKIDQVVSMFGFPVYENM